MVASYLVAFIKSANGIGDGRWFQSDEVVAVTISTLVFPSHDCAVEACPRGSDRSLLGEANQSGLVERLSKWSGIGRRCAGCKARTSTSPTAGEGINSEVLRKACNNAIAAYQASQPDQPVDEVREGRAK